MKILQIGQLPQEMGGSYTTGIARVIGELSRYSYGDSELVIYGTNISDKCAKSIKGYPCKFVGYHFQPFRILMNILYHPIETIKEWKKYKQYEGINPLRMEFYKSNFCRLISEEKPDLIHMHGAGMFALNNANKKYHIPILLTLHGLMWNGDIEDDNASEKKWKILYQHILPMASHYSTLNEKALFKMQLLGIHQDRVSIIPNGVDTKKFFYSESERHNVRKRLDVNESQMVFITVGLVIDRKGQFEFLQILESLDIDYQYWIIGKGPDYDKIHDFINKNHLEHKVKLLGYINDTEIYKYHSAADFYAHASSIEGQALAEIEAYTTGLRIIVNNRIADTVIGDLQNERDKYYVANFEEIDKENLIEWINSPQHNRTTCSKYDWSIIADMYYQKYKQICSY